MKFIQIQAQSIRPWLPAACLVLLVFLAGCALPRAVDLLPPTPTPQATQAPSETPVVASSPTKPATGDAARPTQISTASRTVPPSATSLPGTRTNTPTITRTPTISLTPTITRTPTRTPWVYATWTLAPTKTPTITPTPTPPLAFLRILRPGAYSKLLSPLQVEASISPGDDGLVLVELLGEDGRSLASQRLNYYEYLNHSIAIAPKMEFRLAGVSELGRLVISVNDRYGRRVALTSTELILMSIGDNDASAAGSGVAPYLFRLPVADQIIQGGIIAIRGLARPVSEKPVILELLDEQGKVLANAQLQIALPSGELSHTPFSIDMAYKVSAPMHARLVIRQESANRIPGTVALWSVPINLEP